METDLLLWIHRHGSPLLDAAFRFSDLFGRLGFCVPLVLGVALFHAGRGERREALAWVALGLTTLALQAGLKAAFGRPRPTLWPWLVRPTGFSFPSGHALAAATFFPLLAFDVSRHGRRLTAFAWSAAIALTLFVGVGRLYLGVHWPSDVLAGWALGAGQVALVIPWVSRRPGPAAAPPRPSEGGRARSR